jgi:YfiH family protein
MTPLEQRIRSAGLDWIVPGWSAPASVGALVTTRAGGVSEGAYASMNLSTAVGDDPEAVAENRRRLSSFLPAAPRWLAQAHGTEVVVLGTNPDRKSPVADAAVTRGRGVVCAVLVADCLPVFLADRNGTAVGIAHAGWRGLAAGVIERTVAALGDLGVRGDRLVAWLGPSIGAAAFEVGAEVREAFLAHDAGADAHFAGGAAGKWHADLRALARRRLAAYGVMTVAANDECTKTDDSRFYSWRRDHGGGRMAALVWIAPDAGS